MPLRLSLVLGLLLLAAPAWAQPSFRADTHLAVAAAQTSAIVVAPSGLADGDVVIVFLWRLTDAAVTPPTGFTEKGCRTNGAVPVTLCAYWKRASSEGGSWTFTWSTSAYREAVAIAYSNVVASGDPFSFISTATKDTAADTNYPSISGTTTEDNEMLVWAGGNWNACTSGTSPPTGFTLRDGCNVNVPVAEKVQASAGGTGSLTGSYTGTNAQTVAILLGLKPGTGGGGGGGGGTGAELFLSPTGTDDGVCASSAPCKTFAHAIPLLEPGDTLTLRDGTYSVAAGTGLPSINCSSGAVDGTSDSRITIRADNERSAKLQGTGLAHVFSMVNCSYWTIQGLYTNQIDNASAGAGIGAGFSIRLSDHIILRRNLAYGANRYKNITNIQLDGVTDSLVEENEAYFFHRKGISQGSAATGGAQRNTFRRNYVHSRSADDVCSGCEGDTSGQSSTRGDEGIGLGYPGSNNIAENNIMEDSDNGIVVANASSATVFADSNKALGNIAISNRIGYLVTARCTSASAPGGCAPHDTVLANNVAISSGTAGMWFRGSDNTQVDNATLMNGTSQGLIADESGTEGDGNSSTHVKNALVLNHGSTGLNIVTSEQGGGWSIDRTNAFSNTPNYTPSSSAFLTNSTAVNAELGSCIVWVPESSPMKSTGTCSQAMIDRGECTTLGAGNADKGANILYRYEDGVLTSTPLWDTTTGAFPAGAIVTGINDVAGQSLFDVHTRLNVNTGGCIFPSDYTEPVGGTDPPVEQPPIRPGHRGRGTIKH